MLTKSPGTARWLVTGARGMLGTDVVDLLRRAGHAVTGLGRSNLDILDEAAVHDVVAGHDVVVNCAAWTDVDAAETDEQAAAAVNATGAHVLAAAAAAHRARIVQISTDYVFDGFSSTPYPEDAPTGPPSAYGRTKLEGERLVRSVAPDHLIVRTAWLYGAHGHCFPRTIVRVARERGEVAVVDDQRGQPTWTWDVARVIVDLVVTGAPAGTYHATSAGEATWFDFARAAVAAAGLDAALVRPIQSAELSRPAPRPAFSVLASPRLERAGVARIGPWDERWAYASGAVLAPGVDGAESHRE